MEQQHEYQILRADNLDLRFRICDMDTASNKLAEEGSGLSSVKGATVVVTQRRLLFKEFNIKDKDALVEEENNAQPIVSHAFELSDILDIDPNNIIRSEN